MGEHATRLRTTGLLEADRVSSSTDEPVRFALFGGVRIVRGDHEVEVTQPKQRALLALLLANAGNLIPMSSIIDALWTRTPAATAINQVHRHIGALRRACEPWLGRRQAGRFITGGSRGYRIDVEPDRYDVNQLHDLASRAQRLVATGRRDDAVAHYLQALSFASAPAGDEDLQRLPEFAAIEDERVRTIIAASEQCSSPADFRAVLPLLRSAAARHPFNESVQAGLMNALARTGRAAEAVDVYRAVRESLREELGTEPGAELRQARVDAFRVEQPGEPDPDTLVLDTTRLPKPAQLPMPLPGFVGRRRLLAALAEPTRHRRVVLIAGVAGVGKTSVAVRHATDVMHRYPDGQLYVNLCSDDPAAAPVTPIDALGDMLHGLNVPVESMPDSVGARSGLLRSILATQQALVLLDNACDYRQIEPLLPGPGRSDVIVTSRTRMPALLVFNHAELIELEPFEDGELLEFFERRMPAGAAEDVDGTLIRLGRAYGRLPLALTIIAARAAANPDVPLEQFARSCT